LNPHLDDFSGVHVVDVEVTKVLRPDHELLPVGREVRRLDREVLKVDGLVTIREVVSFFILLKATTQPCKDSISRPMRNIILLYVTQEGPML
jgi:hypothetical protein